MASEVMVIASKVKAYIKASGLNTSGTVMSVLTDKVSELCDQAVASSSSRSGRRTDAVHYRVLPVTTAAISGSLSLSGHAAEAEAASVSAFRRCILAGSNSPGNLDYLPYIPCVDVSVCNESYPCRWQVRRPYTFFSQ